MGNVAQSMDGEGGGAGGGRMRGVDGLGGGRRAGGAGGQRGGADSMTAGCRAGGGDAGVGGFGILGGSGGCSGRFVSGDGVFGRRLTGDIDRIPPARACEAAFNHAVRCRGSMHLGHRSSSVRGESQDAGSLLPALSKYAGCTATGATALDSHGGWTHIREGPSRLLVGGKRCKAEAPAWDAFEDDRGADWRPGTSAAMDNATSAGVSEF